MRNKDINGYDLYRLKKEYDLACRGDHILEHERKQREKERDAYREGPDIKLGHMGTIIGGILLGGLVVFVLVVDIISAFI